MKRIVVAALVAGAVLAHAETSPAKKELVAKLLALQQPDFEQAARGLVERPAAQMMQEASKVVQTQVPPDKRDAVGKSIEADVKKYVDESVPIVRDRAIKLAPSAIGATLEEKLSEDDLKQIIAWFESPVNKKYQQIVPELQNAYFQKLVADSRPLIDPKLQALVQKVRATLSAAVPGAAASAAPAPTSGTAPAKQAASAAKGSAK